MPTSATRATVTAGRGAMSEAVTSGSWDDAGGPDSGAPDSGAPDSGVRRAQRGDVSAFEAIYRVHAGRVHALCLRMAGDPASAADLTRDVFVRAWERLGELRGGAVLATWLHRMTLSLVLEWARAESGRAPRGRAADDAPGATARPGERLDYERAVAALPTAARAALVLHDVEGYTHAEIARLTGAAEGTVRAQLHQARRRLMEALSR
jgi:RNA polymerase sigma-70 factor, ECF subfamily